jgi:hypothetical protein
VSGQKRTKNYETRQKRTKNYETTLLRRLRKVKKQAGPEYDRFYPSELLYLHAPKKIRMILEDEVGSTTIFLKNYANASSAFDPINKPKTFESFRFLMKLYGII